VVWRAGNCLSKIILRLFFVSALSCWIAAECAAQGSTAPPGSEYRSVVRFQENDVTVPSRFGTHILVTVSVNGSPTELALDTGASFSPISVQAAKELKLKRAKGVYIGCDSFSKEYAEAKIQIGKIVVGNQRLCPVLERGVKSEVAERQLAVPGLLGYDFLRNFVVEVDYARRLVVLHNPQTFEYRPDAGYVGEVPFRLVNGTPHLDVTMVFGDESRQQIDALVDTGSWKPVMVTDQVFAMWAKKGTPYGWRSGSDWVLDIREVTRHQPNPVAGPVNFDAVLGNPALARYKVIFDYPRGRLILSDSLVR
jgi:predicted aspartyl protease